MNYKETEKLIEKYIGCEKGTHEANGNIVHEYFSRTDTYLRIALKNEGFESIKTNSSYTAEYWSEKYLSNVSYCEGDVYIVQYDNLEDFNQGKQIAIAFYLNN